LCRRLNRMVRKGQRGKNTNPGQGARRAIQEWNQGHALTVDNDITDTPNLTCRLDENQVMEKTCTSPIGGMTESLVAKLDEGDGDELDMSLSYSSELLPEVGEEEVDYSQVLVNYERILECSVERLSVRGEYIGNPDQLSLMMLLVKEEEGLTGIVNIPRSSTIRLGNETTAQVHDIHP
jgi:hypothetical protein